MADDLKKPNAQDRSRVNVNEPHEVRYWTKRWQDAGDMLAETQPRGLGLTA